MMEIKRVLMGENTNFSSTRLVRNMGEKAAQTGRSSTDRLELSRQWIQTMEEQRVQTEAALLTGSKEKEKKSNSILDMLDEPNAEQEELDALSRQLDVQMKCMKIAANIMKGTRVPPEDEQYLMENDPEGYKLALSMRSLAKEDDEECESVLKDEDKNGEEISDSGESAPAESSGGGEAAVSVE